MRSGTGMLPSDVDGRRARIEERLDLVSQLPWLPEVHVSGQDGLQRHAGRDGRQRDVGRGDRPRSDRVRQDVADGLRSRLGTAPVDGGLRRPAFTIFAASQPASLKPRPSFVVPRLAAGGGTNET